jgi:hypothetical protein
MLVDRAGLAERLRSFAMTMLGLVLSFVPLGLWFAWTEAMLLAVVVIAVVSAVLSCCYRSCRVPLPRSWRRSGNARQGRLSPTRQWRRCIGSFR